MATTPDDNFFTNGDYDNFPEIMHSTNALRRNNDESETKPKAMKQVIVDKLLIRKEKM